MNMRAFALLAVMTIVGCIQSNQPVFQNSGWTDADLVDWRYSREFEGGAIAYRFQEDGLVAITISQGDEPPVAPYCYWSIDSDGVLLISQDREATKVQSRIRLLRLDDDSAFVLHNEKTETLDRRKTTSY